MPKRIIQSQTFLLFKKTRFHGYKINETVDGLICSKRKKFINLDNAKNGLEKLSNISIFDALPSLFL